jgi:CDP-paratose 2-epimerase
MNIIVTGATGFIGTNTCLDLVNSGHKVLGIDNLSRKTGEVNLAELGKNTNFDFIKSDLTFKDKDRLKAIETFKPTAVIHLAGQVAVTTSIIDPTQDFNSNLFATFNLLINLTELNRKPKFIYASTNKVYGNLDSLQIKETDEKFVLIEKPHGIDEEQQFEPHSPYGCSKGAADNYSIDFRRSFNLPTYVLRQSCIYGKHQFGIEDQGWVAWFAIAALLNKRVTIFGSGKQTRDILFVDDLVELYKKIISIETRELKSYTFNVGGGFENAISILQLIKYLKNYLDLELPFDYSMERMGDQKIFVSNNELLKKEFGWIPKTNIENGLSQMINWMRENVDTIRKYTK